MMRIMAMRTKAAAMRQCCSKSRASRRLRLIHPMVRSTIQRFGSTTNLCLSQRLTISIFHLPVRATAAVHRKPMLCRPHHPSAPANRLQEQRIKSDSAEPILLRIALWGTTGRPAKQFVLSFCDRPGLVPVRLAGAISLTLS
jgi:hypothetical protein